MSSCRRVSSRTNLNGIHCWERSYPMAIVTWLFVDAIDGCRAALIVGGYRLGLLANILLGIAGALIAGWLLPVIGFILIGGFLAAIVNAVIGSVPRAINLQ